MAVRFDRKNNPDRLKRFWGVQLQQKTRDLIRLLNSDRLHFSNSIKTKTNQEKKSQSISVCKIFQSHLY